MCVWVCAFDAISQRHFGSCSQLTDVPALISVYNLFSFQACASAAEVGGYGGGRCSGSCKQLMQLMHFQYLNEGSSKLFLFMTTDPSSSSAIRYNDATLSVVGVGDFFIF